MSRAFYVYIMANPDNHVLYTGITHDLIRRVYEHRMKLIKGFTYQYNVIKLVYYESIEDPLSAIAREKQIKAGSREKKMRLILKMNPDLKDLYEEIA